MQQGQKLIESYSTPRLGTYLESMLNGESETVGPNGEIDSTLALLVNGTIDALAKVNSDPSISASDKAAAYSFVNGIIRVAVSTIGLQSVTDSESLPVAKLLRSLSNARISVDIELEHAANKSLFNNPGQVANLSILLLKSGATSASLTLARAATQAGFELAQLDSKTVTQSFMNATIQAQGAGTVKASLRMQENLVDALKIMPIEPDLKIKGRSITEFCTGKPELSFLTNHLAKTALDRVLREDTAATNNSDDEQLTTITRNRVF